MADSNDAPDNRVAKQFELIDAWETDGKIPSEAADRLHNFGQAIYDEIPYPSYENADGDTDLKAASTTYSYLVRLRVDVYDNGECLTDLSADGFNQLMADLDADRARGTTQSSQSAAKAYYRWHDDLGVDPDDIEFFPNEDNTGVDPDTVLTPEEINQMRQAIDGSRNPVRNRAILDILYHTGQRWRAIQTLKLDDVYADEKPGYIHLNDEVKGLKGADGRGSKRPLLGARAAVRDWVNCHPKRDDSDAWLFCGSPSHSRSSADKPLEQKSVNYMLKKAAKGADIDPSRVTPHKLRHAWVTNMRRNYPEISWDEIESIGGWSEGSNIAKTVYQHLSDEEHHKNVEEKMGIRASTETRDTMVPCGICGENVKPESWDECPRCNEPLSHTSEAVTESPMGKLVESAAKADGEAKEGAEKSAEILDQFPGLKEEIKAELKDEVKADLLDDL